jgi:hypothetical protein
LAALALALLAGPGAAQESSTSGARTKLHGNSPPQSDDNDSLPLDTDQPSAVRGSPYVELDSWIYPAVDRLVVMDYIRSGRLSEIGNAIVVLFGILVWAAFVLSVYWAGIGAVLKSRRQRSGGKARRFKGISKGSAVNARHM